MYSSMLNRGKAISSSMLKGGKGIFSMQKSIVNRPGSSLPPEKANDQVGIPPQSNNVPQMFPSGLFHLLPHGSENIESDLLALDRQCNFEELVKNMKGDTPKIRKWYVGAERRLSESNTELGRMMDRYSDKDLGRMMARSGLLLLEFLRTDAVLRNLVRFETSKQEKRSQPLMSYVDLMDRLIDTPEDVQALRYGGIIHNHLGSNNDVASVWNRMRRELPAEINKYKPIGNAMDDVISFYTNKHRIMYTEFKRRYFSKPWIVLSVISACILLVSSVWQTILARQQVNLQRESMPKT